MMTIKNILKLTEYFECIEGIYCRLILPRSQDNLLRIVCKFPLASWRHI
jgi:hypothetical protein